MALTQAKLAVVVFTSIAFAAGGAGVLGRHFVVRTPVEPTTIPPGTVVQDIADAAVVSLVNRLTICVFQRSKIEASPRSQP
jgi:hypothetical protein